MTQSSVHFYRLPLTPTLRRISHVVVLSLGWLLYFYYLTELRLAPPGDLSFILLLLLAFFLLIFITDTSWVFYNIRLSRRKQVREVLQQTVGKYDTDWNGFAVEADWAQMKRSKIINIEIRDKRKIYTELNKREHNHNG